MSWSAAVVVSTPGPKAKLDCTVRVFTMDSAALGLGLLGCGCCTVRFFRQEFTLEDAIGSHAFTLPLEARPCVWPMAFLSGSPLFLPVHTVNCVQTLKVTALTLTLTLTTVNCVQTLKVFRPDQEIFQGGGTLPSVQQGGGAVPRDSITLEIGLSSVQYVTKIRCEVEFVRCTLHPEFCCVRVRVIGLRLLYVARF
jgi:hypothetical protein